MAVYIDGTMTLEQKLAAIDEALKQAGEQRTAGIEAPTDPAELVMCEGCQ